jgi:polyisoprenoid-binding protein YceI
MSSTGCRSKTTEVLCVTSVRLARRAQKPARRILRGSAPGELDASTPSGEAIAAIQTKESAESVEPSYADHTAPDHASLLRSYWARSSKRGEEMKKRHCWVTGERTFLRSEAQWSADNVPVRLAVICLLLYAMFPSTSRAQGPVFEITPVESSIKFDVEASVAIKGTFDKWDATLTFASPNVESAVLDVKIQADSVDTGSGMKNGKLKGKDFFDVKQSPLITFKSTKIVQTGPDTFEVDGDFTIRGVSKAEKLTLTVSGKGTGSGEIKGVMAFDRKQYGMNSGIPFIKIADRVEVSIALKGKQVSGPPLVFKQ